MRSRAQNMLVDLLTLPTSPFNEQFVVDYIRRWVAERPNLKLSVDTFGNLRVRLRRGPANPSGPLVFSAHMDHPGFEAQSMAGPGRVRALWRGGVPPEYFPGAAIRFYSEGRWVRGKIEQVKVARDARGRQRVATVVAAVRKSVAPESIGMWDFGDPIIRGSRIYARGCDDVGGVAAVMAALDELAAGKVNVDQYATFTRAEEVGFAGAIAGAQNGLIPKNARVVAVETSSEIPGVSMGNGPILRVGDKDAIFTPSLTAFCREVAESVAKRDKTFKFQRKLMDAGTCESAAFCEYGFKATGLCIALGNYHNVDRARERLGPEYIDLNDWNDLVKWFVALGASKDKYVPEGNPAFREVLDRLDREYTPTLLRTVGRVMASRKLTSRHRASCG